jgi:hypothetical protein
MGSCNDPVIGELANARHLSLLSLVGASLGVGFNEESSGSVRVAEGKGAKAQGDSEARKFEFHPATMRRRDRPRLAVDQCRGADGALAKSATTRKCPVAPRLRS